MKKYILLLSMFVVHHAFGMSFQSISEFNSNNEFQKSLKVNCDVNNYMFCEHLCNNKAMCVIAEPLCQDCVTIKNQSLYSAYLDGQSIFEVDQDIPVTKNLLIEFLKNEKFISLTFDSVLNILNPEKKEQIKVEFNKLCGPNSRNSVLFASLNQETKSIDRITGIMCQNRKDVKFKPVKVNSNFSKEPNLYWNSVRWNATQSILDWKAQQEAFVTELALTDSFRAKVLKVANIYKIKYLISK